LTIVQPHFNHPTLYLSLTGLHSAGEPDEVLKDTPAYWKWLRIMELLVHIKAGWLFPKAEQRPSLTAAANRD
jgi:hypothetical protein